MNNYSSSRFDRRKQLFTESLKKFFEKLLRQQD